MAKKYVLDEKVTLQVKKAYYNYITHRAIVSEMVRANPDIVVSETQVYKDMQKCLVEYDEVSASAIKQATNLNSIENISWRIDFVTNELVIG